MRRLFMTSVALAAMAAPVLAQSAYDGYAPASGDPLYSSGSLVSGDIELSLGRGWSDDSKDVNIFQGRGRANVNLGNTWNLLFETGGSALFGGDLPDGDSHSEIGVYGHVWRGANGIRYGAFGGVDFNEWTVGTVGVEAAVDLNNMILGAQGSYSFVSDSDEDFWGLRGWADYYITANTKVGAELAWQHYNDYGSYNVYEVSGRVTHRFDGTPFNIFGEASYLTVADENYDSYGIAGGFSVILDGAGGTQHSYDQQVPFEVRNGSSLGVFASDRRLKADIVKVGMLTGDIPLYRFRYIWGDEVFVGVMAQDLLAVRPDAVATMSNGYYAVDYAALGTRMMRLEEWQAIDEAHRAVPGDTAPIGTPAG